MHQRNKIAVQEIIFDCFHLHPSPGAGAEIERFIIPTSSLRIYIIGLRIDSWRIARRAIHRFVRLSADRRLSSTERGDMKLIVPIFDPMQLIGHQLQFRDSLLSSSVRLALVCSIWQTGSQHVAVIEQIIASGNRTAATG